jgi:hypothetical protein
MMEMQSLEIKLESIEKKLTRSQLLHQSYLQRKASEARAKNDHDREKTLL